jgi:hypothetical protein
VPEDVDARSEPLSTSRQTARPTARQCNHSPFKEPVLLCPLGLSTPSDCDGTSLSGSVSEFAVAFAVRGPFGLASRPNSVTSKGPFRCQRRALPMCGRRWYSPGASSGWSVLGGCVVWSRWTHQEDLISRPG